MMALASAGVASAPATELAAGVALRQEAQLLQRIGWVEAPRLEIRGSFRDLLRLPAAIATLHTPLGTPLLSVEQLAKDQSFFRDATVSFNKAKTVWTARWAKPRLFNFGMLLKPELLKRVSLGQSLLFSSQGQPAALSKSDGNELLMEQQGERRSLSARDIVHLLESRIETGGLSLFLDGGGDLVMEARGPGAAMLAQATL